MKVEEERYYKMYRTSDSYLELKLQEAKIYQKQLNHDMCLKCINSMETFIKERDENVESNLLTPQIMEIRAEVELNKNHVNSFM